MFSFINHERRIMRERILSLFLLCVGVLTANEAHAWKKPYIEPTEGAVAKIVFRLDAGRPKNEIYFHLCESVPSPYCEGYTIAHRSTSLFKTKPMKGSAFPKPVDNGVPVEVVVRADRPLVFEVSSRGFHVCGGDYRFLPVDGGRYEILFKTTFDSCRTEIVRLIETVDGGQAREDVPDACRLGLNGECLPSL